MTCYQLAIAPTQIPPAALPERVVAVLGFFDGMHHGHTHLFAAAKQMAAACGVPCCVWSFTDEAGKGAPHLTSTAERLCLMAQAGAEYAVLAEFSAVRELSPVDFVKQILCDTLHCAAVVCGFNFRFGCGGKGDVTQLAELLAKEGIALTVLPPITTEDGTVISATEVRGALARGEAERAAVLLGRWYSFEAVVVPGAKLGRTIGIPTINQRPPAMRALPKAGVYVALCEPGDGKRYPAVANIGVKPTVGDERVMNVETHLLGYEGDLYGKTVRVAFCRRLRAERKFPDLAALCAQINRDVTAAEAFFAITEPLPM